MRLQVTRSKNAASLYVIKSVYENCKRSTKVIEHLGTEKELREKLGGKDPYEWAQEYIRDLNEKEKASKREVILRCSPVKQIAGDEQMAFNGGYLFLQQIYHRLGLDKICRDITEKHRFQYDMDSIFSRLLYSRIIYPSSKLNTYKQSSCFLEKPNFELHQIYRALEVIAAESDYIQSEVYKNSAAAYGRNSRVLYYDCTNYYFEIEQEDGIRQYGFSKENRPNPIVEMGLFMDADGMPLAFCIHSGNTNEQTTLQPLEEKILSDFKLSRFIVCTDAGLASTANRKFNDVKDRAFITTQSIKTLKQSRKEWALSSSGWKIPGEKGIYDLDVLQSDPELYEKYKDTVFYKNQWIKDNDLEQNLIVTFSLKYRDYQRLIRNRQIERAEKYLSQSHKNTKTHGQNDFKRFISYTEVTADGEVAEHRIASLDLGKKSEEEQYDGFYAVCTDLEDDPMDIIRVNHRRWEIEECFRIMKSEFKARPVYLKNDDRIRAHFMTCFLALLLYRILEKKLDCKYTSTEIIDALRNFDFLEVSKEGYLPLYTRTSLTDALHDQAGFRTDYQIVPISAMKKIFKETKTHKK